jgi:hypothetical protein
MIRKQSLLIPALFLIFVVSLSLCAINGVVSAATVEDVALMKSPNREKLILEGARKEGKVSFYTALELNVAQRPTPPLCREHRRLAAQRAGDQKW